MNIKEQISESIANIAIEGVTSIDIEHDHYQLTLSLKAMVLEDSSEVETNTYDITHEHVLDIETSCITIHNNMQLCDSDIKEIVYNGFNSAGLALSF